MTAVDVDHAYRHCESITRTQARNFSYGIRLLLPPKRRALSAVYAFARRIDDIGDGDLPHEEKLVRLEDARRDLEDVRSGRLEDHLDDMVLVALADAAASFPIPLAAFDELIEGCAADVRGTTYVTFDELLHYCRCVAGSIGRLSLGVFGAEDLRVAASRADALGVALQLTNILRDVREDHLTGRTYLPAEDLNRFGVRLEPEDSGYLRDPGAPFVELVRFEAERAREWYAQGLPLLSMLDRRSAACTAAMAGIYRGLHDRIAADPAAVLRSRTSLTGWEKVLVAVRSLAGVPI
ncbi:MAG: presqualene diphosphate synthase HpnD [Streptosporangiales bacterium]|nr:presqualene diphosphate synthase HpnD [Streptosporangiales bacterium]